MARIIETNVNQRVNSIVEGTSLEGEIKSEGNFRIDGHVKGNIDIKGRMIIGAKGVVKGTLLCQEAEIEGEFNGNIKVTGLLSLKSTAQIFGEAIFEKLKVEEGAQLSCSCNIKSGSRMASTASTGEKKSIPSSPQNPLKRSVETMQP